MQDIVQIVSKKVALSDQKGLKIGCCPFHSEKAPSFIVNPEKQTFTCLSCGAAGDVTDFLALYCHMSRDEVLRKTSEEETEHKFNKRLSDINKAAAEYYSWRLTTKYGESGLNYFRSRGLTDETIKKFSLGVSNDFGSHLVERLKKLGYTEDEIESAGISLKHNGNTVDRFWDRVMFPLKDADGQFLGFTGRTLQSTADKMKYCNTPETDIFRKREVIYGLDLAKDSVSPYFILVEGNMDVISMHQAGFTNTIATCGTALTKEQCLVMRKYKRKVILMYDTDAAGVQATKRAIRLFNEAGISVQCTDSLPYKDPDEFLRREDPSRMEMKLKDRVDYRDYLVRNGSPEEAVNILLSMDPVRYQKLIG